MADLMPKKDYDLTEITRLLLEMRDNCVPKAGDAHDDPKRTEKYDALNAAIDLINNPSMLPKWISVKDRLPEEEKEVLCYLGNSIAKLMVVAFRRCGEWYFDGWPCPTVTHWMPLPKPPKEDEKND